MSDLFTELALSMTFLMIMMTIQFLIDYWIDLSIIIRGKLTRSVSDENFGTQMILSSSIVSGVLAVVIDVCMVQFPSAEQIILTLHLCLWGANTFVLGILVSIYGSRMNRFFAKPDFESPTYGMIYRRFRILHVLYAVAGFGYGIVYIVAIFVTVWYYHIESWYVMYSLFHSAIIGTGFVMILIFKKGILSHHSSSKSEKLSIPDHTAAERGKNTDEHSISN